MFMNIHELTQTAKYINCQTQLRNAGKDLGLRARIQTECQAAFHALDARDTR